MDNLQIGESFKVKTGSSDGLSLRSQATTKDGTKNIILSIPNDAKVTLASDKVQTSNKSTWYEVKYTDKDKKDVTGWVASDYLEELLPPFSLPTLSFSALWVNHPGEEVPCDENAFKNQCAIRMGIALEKSRIDLSFFQGERCWQKNDEKHVNNTKHILRAQELADWLRKRTKLVGKVTLVKPGPKAQDAIAGKKGIVFFQNIPGYEGLDHIDVWHGQGLRSTTSKKWSKSSQATCPPEWWKSSQQIWFWDLCPCTLTTKSAPVYSKPDVNFPAKITLDPTGLEVVDVQGNWVQVNNFVDEEVVTSFIQRRFVLFPGQDVAPKAAPISLPTLSWSGLWDSHPVEQRPCDQTALENQGAVRMGVALGIALEKSGVNLDSFQGARCGVKHDPSHILSAQELADWLRTQTKLVGNVKIYKQVTWEDFKGKRGIMFIQKPTGNKGLDHIDLWTGKYLKGMTGGKVRLDWISACEQVWFWDLWPCMTNSSSATVPVYSKADVTSSSEMLQSNKPVEVVKVEDDWVTVNMTKYVDPTKVGSVRGFIERGYIMFPDQDVAA